MIDLVAFIVCIVIMIVCLIDLKCNSISSQGGYKILGIISAVCVLILL